MATSWNGSDMQIAIFTATNMQMGLCPIGECVPKICVTTIPGSDNYILTERKGNKVGEGEIDWEEGKVGLSYCLGGFFGQEGSLITILSTEAVHVNLMIWMFYWMLNVTAMNNNSLHSCNSSGTFRNVTSI